MSTNGIADSLYTSSKTGTVGRFIHLETVVYVGREGGAIYLVIIRGERTGIIIHNNVGDSRMLSFNLFISLVLV